MLKPSAITIVKPCQLFVLCTCMHTQEATDCLHYLAWVRAFSLSDDTKDQPKPHLHVLPCTNSVLVTTGTWHWMSNNTLIVRIINIIIHNNLYQTCHTKKWLIYIKHVTQRSGWFISNISHEEVADLYQTCHTKKWLIYIKHVTQRSGWFISNMSHKEVADLYQTCHTKK